MDSRDSAAVRQEWTELSEERVQIFIMTKTWLPRTFSHPDHGVVVFRGWGDVEELRRRIP